MCQPARNPAERAFIRQCQVLVCASLVLYIACSQASLYLGRSFAGDVLSGLAGLFIFLELSSAGTLIYRRFDEFQRVLLQRSFFWASVVTVGVLTVWGFVEMHGRSSVVHLPLLSVPAMLIITTACTKLLIFRQHRSPVE